MAWARAGSVPRAEQAVRVSAGSIRTDRRPIMSICAIILVGQRPFENIKTHKTCMYLLDYQEVRDAGGGVFEN